MRTFLNVELTETRENLLKEITLLSDEEFNRNFNPEKWSIAQVCHHLILVEIVSIQVIEWGLKNKQPSSKERKNIDLILDRTTKIRAPKMVEPDEGPFELEAMIRLLEKSREALISSLNLVEDVSSLTQKAVNHPVFGELPLDQWVELIYLHEQRHIEQIKEIKSVINVSH